MVAHRAWQVQFAVAAPWMGPHLQGLANRIENRRSGAVKDRSGWLVQTMKKAPLDLALSVLHPGSADRPSVTTSMTTTPAFSPVWT